MNKQKKEKSGRVDGFEPGKPPTTPQIQAIAAICHVGSHIHIYMYTLCRLFALTIYFTRTRLVVPTMTYNTASTKYNANGIRIKE